MSERSGIDIGKNMRPTDLPHRLATLFRRMAAGWLSGLLLIAMADAWGQTQEQRDPLFTYSWRVGCTPSTVTGSAKSIGEVHDACIAAFAGPGQVGCGLPTYESAIQCSCQSIVTGAFCNCRGTNIGGLTWDDTCNAPATCDAGFNYSKELAKCVREDCSPGQVRDPSTGHCIVPEVPKEPPPECGGGDNGAVPGTGLGVGNPISAGSGNKHQDEVIYIGAMLEYRLRYISRLPASGYLPQFAQGPLRVTSYNRNLAPSSGGALSGMPAAVASQRPNGQLFNFSRQGSTDTYLPDADINHRLVRRVDTNGATGGWQLVSGGGDTETYDANGQLLAIADRSGLTQTLAYDAQGRLATVTDAYGRQLMLAYDAQNRVMALTQPEGGVVHFTYDGANNLAGITWPDGKTKTYVYEDSRYPNHLTGVIDENGVRYATWSYDDQGRAVGSEHAGGAERVTLAYGVGSTIVTDAVGTSRSKGLTTILGVVKSSGASQPGGSGCGAASSSVSYDANGNVASQTDFNGHVTTYTYDLRWNLETQRVEAAGKPEARTVSSQWHGYWRQPVAVAEPKKRTTWTYNGDGGVYCAPPTATVPSLTGGTQPIGVVCTKSEQATNDASGAQGFGAALVGTPRTWRYTYNAYGQVLTADGPRTDVADVTTTTYYDAADPDLGKRGNPATITNAQGHVTRITAYDLNGKPLTIVDPNGVATTLTYDLRQRLTSRTIGTETTTYAYDAVGQLLKVTLPDGSYTAYAYDPAHRLTQLSDALGNSVTYTLDALGNRLREDVKDPSGQLARTRSRIFDALSRLAQEIGAQGQVTAYEYDANGNRMKVTDPLSHVTASSYDALNRLVAVTDPGQGVVRYGYDGQDRLAAVTDPRGLVTRYTVDGLGNATQQASPDSGTTARQFDAAGNETSRTDAAGQTTMTTYDALNRPLQVSYVDGRTVAYAWDLGSNGLGRLGRIDEAVGGQAVGSLAYAYDEQGRVVGETRTLGGVSQTVGYTYAGGQLAGMSYPSGRSLAYDRDAAGRIVQVRLVDGGQATVLAGAITYAPFGGVSGWVDGAGQVHSRSYDQDGRVSGYSLGGQPWLVNYDAASRIIGQVDGGNAASSGIYAYDALDRLTGASLPDAGYGYAYDASGNRTSQTTGGVARPYTVDGGSNRLLAVGGTPATAYSYDANGSVTGDGTASYGYDAGGRLAQAATAAGTTQYATNALGQRIRKRGGAGETIYAYDRAGHLIAESDGAGRVQREYVWLGETPLAVLQ